MVQNNFQVCYVIKICDQSLRRYVLKQSKKNIGFISEPFKCFRAAIIKPNGPRRKFYQRILLGTLSRTMFRSYQCQLQVPQYFVSYSPRFLFHSATAMMINSDTFGLRLYHTRNVLSEWLS